LYHREQTQSKFCSTLKNDCPRVQQERKGITPVLG
jgi:hypothetical protein